MKYLKSLLFFQRLTYYMKKFIIEHVYINSLFFSSMMFYDNNDSF